MISFVHVVLAASSQGTERPLARALDFARESYFNHSFRDTIGVSSVSISSAEIAAPSKALTRAGRTGMSGRSAR